uniref:Uncharacterized protein n=1 Tax=Sphaerodactylus townsendi TaxID=933632 RepID=A0ACB8FT71_9SAUR
MNASLGKDAAYETLDFSLAGERGGAQEGQACRRLAAGEGASLSEMGRGRSKMDTEQDEADLHLLLRAPPMTGWGWGLRNSSVLESTQGCGTRIDKSGERIFDGNVADEGEWPWQASLQLQGTHRCGASLISSSWLVTAAHCFKGFKKINFWTASFGARLRSPKMKRNIRQIIVHEHYADNVLSHEYDIAVVEISPPVQFSAEVHHVCLPEATQVFSDNTTCFVTGWGALKDDGEKLFTA